MVDDDLIVILLKRMRDATEKDLEEKTGKHDNMGQVFAEIMTAAELAIAAFIYLVPKDKREEALDGLLKRLKEQTNKQIEDITNFGVNLNKRPRPVNRIINL